jgi:hypothetical protein
VWGTSRAGVDRLAELFSETAAWMLSRGAVDQDQAVLAFAYLRHPEAFDAWYVVKDWAAVLREF